MTIMTPQEILTAITLAVSGWTLLQVIDQGKTLSALNQQIDDLPCPGKPPCTKNEKL